MVGRWEYTCKVGEFPACPLSTPGNDFQQQDPRTNIYYLLHFLYDKVPQVPSARFPHEQVSKRIS
jgi:hypothetical protein